MRKRKSHKTAGNCCCLVPVLILLAIIVAALIGAAFVWHNARPSAFRWDSRPHHYEAYRDGYHEGNRVGAAYARRGDPEPTEQALDALVLREADRLHVRMDRGQWIAGFRNGFARGFGKFRDEALNKLDSWSRFTAVRQLPAKLA